ITNINSFTMVLIPSYININNKAVLNNVNLAQLIMNERSFLFRKNIAPKSDYSIQETLCYCVSNFKRGKRDEKEVFCIAFSSFCSFTFPCCMWWWK
ncbi:MAG: hypothetical protein WAW77_11650, partial [Caldibacillus thermoamylovorans]